MAVERIGRAVLELLTDSSKFFTDIAKAKREGAGLGDAFKQPAKDVKAFGSQLTNLGTIAKTVFSAGLLGGLTAVGNEFQQATSLIVKQTGATGDALKGLQTDLKEVMKQVPDSVHTAAEAISDLHVRLGLTGPALQDATVDLLNYARVNRVEVAEATRTVTQLMNDLGISADHLPEILDKLTAASQASGISVTRLAELVSQQDDALKELGFGLDESIALFAQFEKAGAEPESTIKALTIAVKNMAKDGVTDAHQALGLLLDRIKSAPNLVAASKIAVEAFGKAGVTMAGDIRSGKFEIDGMLKVVQGAKGTLDRTSEASLTTSERFQRMFNSVKVGLEPFGSFLLSLGAAPLAISSVGSAAVSLGGGLKSLSARFTETGTAATTMSVGARGLSGVLFGPIGLIAALLGAAAAFTYFKTRDIQANADAMFQASTIVKKAITNVVEAKQILDAFNAGKTGQKLEGGITLDMAAAWQKGADSIRNLGQSAAITNDQIGATSITIAGFATAATQAATPAERLALAKAGLAAAAKLYADELTKGGPALKLEIQHMDETGQKAEALATKYGVSIETVNRFKKELEKGEKTSNKYAEALRDIEKAQIPLTEAQWAGIKPLLEMGVNQDLIAKKFGVSSDAIDRYKEKLESLKAIHDDISSVARHLTDNEKDWLKEWDEGVSEVVGDIYRLNTAIQEIEDQADLDLGVEDVRRSIEQVEGAIEDIGTKSEKALGTTFKTAFVETLGSLPSLITSAFASGGGILGSLKAVGGRLADALVTPLLTRLTSLQRAGIGVGASLATAIGGSAGGGTGAQVASIASGLGGAALAATHWGVAMAHAGVAGSVALSAATLGIGAAAVGAAVLIKHFTSTKGRNAVKDFVKQFGGFDAIHAKLLTLGDAGERLWRQLTQGVGRNNPAAAKRAIEAITAALEHQAQIEAQIADKRNELAATQQEIQEKTQAALEKYGLTWKDTGRAFQDAHLDEEANQLYEELQLLQRAGVDNAVIFSKMHDSIGKYLDEATTYGSSVTDGFGKVILSMIDTGNITDADYAKLKTYFDSAVKFGTEIPSSWKPVVQKLIDMGYYTDQNNDGIIDLQDTGITFSQTTTEGFQSVVDKLEDIKQALADLVQALIHVGDEAVRQGSRARNGLAQIGTAVPRGEAGPASEPSPVDPNAPGSFTTEPIAVPRPMASGGFGSVTRPTLFIAGERGPEEFAFSGAHQRFGDRTATGPAPTVTQPVTVNINGPVFAEDEYVRDRLTPQIIDAVRRGGKLGTLAAAGVGI